VGFQVSHGQERGSGLAAPSYTSRMWTSYHHRPTARATLICVGSSYATVGAIGRLWTMPSRIQTTESATCASALVPPTLYPRSALFGIQEQARPSDTFPIRHALNKRLREPPVGLWTWNWLLARPLPVFGAQLTSQPSPGIYFGLPHNEPARGCRTGPPQIAPTCKLHLHHGVKRGENRECFCMRTVQKTQGAMCSF
jgi:hypothetical protein